MLSIFYNKFSILILISIFTFSSCSKSSEDLAEITVSTSDFSTSMDENPANGEIIGTIQGSTNEGSVSFSISEQNPYGAFTIDAASGELKVEDASLFNFETNPTITGIVKVANGAVFKNASVTITLNEIANIYEGDIILKTQQEVNDFGANQYTKVTGSVTIGDPEVAATTDIFDLTPLQSLKIINNSLVIINNPNLISTTGLNIHQIGGELIIAINSSLEKVLGLNNLTSVQDLIISTNNILSDLSGLTQLTVIENTLGIIACPLMSNLDWLSNLNTLGSNLTIRNCNSLTNINGLQNLINLTEPYRFFDITGNMSLTDLDGLRNLNTNIYSMVIESNPSLLSVEGLENLKITNTLNIKFNQMLENLRGFERTTSLLDKLAISDNNSLINLQGLNNLTNALEISLLRNEGLLSLDGLNNLSENWKTDIQGNIKLTNFCALENLFAIAPPINFYTAYNSYNPTKQDIINGDCSL